MADEYRRIAEFDSIPVLPLAVYGPGTYTQKLLTQGNSLLSSVIVLDLDVGASVAARWYDVTLAEQEGEEYDLISHTTITSAPFEDRRTVTRLHDKPRFELVVSGGNARLGVYVSVVQSFASDLDAALVYDAQIANLLRDKAIPVATYDESLNEFQILRTVNGVLPVAGSFDALPKLIDKRVFGSSSGLVKNVPTTQITYTVPVGKKFTWLSGFATSNALCLWEVYVNGVWMLSNRATHDKPDVELDLGNPFLLNEGDVLTVDVTNKAITGVTSEVQTWIYGSEETA